MWSVIPSLVVLGLVAIAALGLLHRRLSPVGAEHERIAASRALAVATVFQSTHFSEEWMTGFHTRFPALLGLEPMPLWFFVPFNLVWIAVWIVSIPLLRRGRAFAFFAAWFMAIAGVLNGIAHPMMALASGGYFPGLLSSPLVGLAGVILWRRLQRSTSASMSPT